MSPITHDPAAPAFWEGATVLAPMANYTDGPFRRVCKAHGVDVLVSEMIPAPALLRNPNHEGLCRALRFTEAERPIGVQLMISQVEDVAPLMAEVARYGYDFVDLNAGCPMRNITKSGGGSALLQDLPRMQAILAEMVRVSEVPVTVKTRIGWTQDEIVVEEALDRAVDAGVVALALHPRTRKQMYTGRADWDWIARIKARAPIPVIGNGDITTREGIARMRRETGCDAVMIGRGAVGNPWIFSEGGAPEDPWARIEARLAVLRTHFDDMLAEVRRERLALIMFRKHLARYLKGIPHSREWRVELLTERDPRRFVSRLEIFEQAWREGLARMPRAQGDE